MSAVVKKRGDYLEKKMAGVTRLELATSCVTAFLVAKLAGNYASF